MPELGDELRRARLAREVELAEVESATKIRVRYLRAMEEDRWQALPGRAAARGFLGTYADYLGLEREHLLEEFARGPGRTGEIEAIPADMLPQPGALSGRPRWPGLIVGVALIAIVVSGALVLALSDGSDEGGVGGEAAAERSSSSTQGAAGEGDGDGGGAASKRSDSEKKEQDRSESTSGSPNKVKVKLTAEAPVWTCLISDRGKPLVEGETLAAGDERGPFERRAFLAAFGNGAVELEVGGKPVSIPDSPDPVGYRISGSGTRRLGEGERPDCL